MYDLRLIRLLLLPSLFSGLLTILSGILVAGYNVWSYISEEQLFYEYLFGSGGLETYLWQHLQSITSWQGAFFNSPAAYYALVVMVAAIAGLVTYFLLRLAGLISHSLKAGWDSLHSQGKTARAITIELVTGLSLRIISLLCWGLYTSFFTSLAIPFVLVLNRIGIDYINASQPAGWLICLGTLIALVVLVHLHVIFLRLVFLRPRIFGGDLALALAQVEPDSHDSWEG